MELLREQINGLTKRIAQLRATERILLEANGLKKQIAKEKKALPDLEAKMQAAKEDVIELQAEQARLVAEATTSFLGRLESAPEVKAALAKKEIKIKAANRIVAKAGGSVERQREELRKTKESNGDGFKTMPRPKIEKLIAEYRGVKTDHLNEHARAFNEGVIAGLSMVFFNSSEINPEWTKLN